MNVLVANRQRTKKLNLPLLRQIVSAALNELGIKHCELEINLLQARQMAALNETFLKHSGSTDVITFDYFEGKRLRPEVALSGEIFICVDDALTQAKSFQTSWQSELVRYVIHGILHLLGHDDLKPALRRRMKREENRLLRVMTRRFSLAQLARAPKLSA